MTIEEIINRAAHEIAEAAAGSELLEHAFTEAERGQVQNDIYIEATRVLRRLVPTDDLLPTNESGTSYVIARGMRMPAMQIGTLVRKVEGYGFPGEVRAAFTTRAGTLRYVIEATGADYAGMLHIFNPMQIERAEPTK
jgi:hypothetical protein